MKKPVKLVKEKYQVHVNYSAKARKDKLMKFITPSGDSFEVSAEEMMTMLVGQVNSEKLEATFVDTEKIDVVEVERRINFIADKDIKKGETFQIGYTHPYPIEFAIIEEVMKIALIKQDVKRTTLTREYIEKVRRKIKPEQKKFVKKFYAFFKDLLKK